MNRPPRRRSSTALASLALAFLLAAAGGGAAWAKDHAVSISDIKYDPKELKIKKGDTVVWTNDDDRDHTVTADDGSFASKKIATRAAYRRKFSKAGKFKYHCDYHPRMKATVVVED